MTGRDDEQRRQALRRYRTFAGSLLVLMAVFYAATFAADTAGFWLLLARAAAEAGVVGGLADWFAVTALFRQPMGLPIPHTALIPRNKDRLGRGLGRFVEQNFLAPTLLQEKLRGLDPAGRLGRWLSTPRRSRLVAERVVGALPYVVQAVGEERAREWVERIARERITELDLHRMVVAALRWGTQGPHYQRAVDRFAAVLREQLLNHESLIYRKVSERSSWWVPERVDRRLAEKIVAAVEEVLERLCDPDSTARAGFDETVQALVDRAQASSTLAAELEGYKARLLDSPDASAQLRTAWDRLHAALSGTDVEANTRLVTALTGALVSVGRHLQAEPAHRERLNAQLEGFLSRFVVPFRHEIGDFIAEVVASWDADTVSERMELAVGRDLQYIRINGTLVGALVGAGLFLITAAAGGH